MIEEKKQNLRDEISRRERELARLEALPDLEDVADGTVMALAITYGWRAPSRPYVVIGYKVQGLWNLTGEKSPNGVTSDALAEWLSTAGRTLVSARELALIEVEKVDLGVELANLLDALTPKSYGEDTYDESSGRGL